MSAGELHSKIHNNDFQLLDVREPFEYKDGHIESSVNIPLSALLTEIQQHDFESKTQLVMICRAGVRSRMACEALISEGYKFQLYNLTGGMNTWRESGYKVKI